MELISKLSIQGGDLKWIASINRINAANFKQPCPWCIWDKNKTINIKDTWNITTSHVKAAKKLNGPVSENDGYINWPLFRFIEFKKTLIDPLHMCLRITDKIFEKLISLFESYEGKSFDLKNVRF